MTRFEAGVEAPADVDGAEARTYRVLGSTVWVDHRPPPDPAAAHFLGFDAGTACWAFDDDALGDDAAGDDAAHLDLYALAVRLDRPGWLLAGRALQVVEWARTHQACGRCGTATEPVPGERARRCPGCGLQGFPRLAPAAIVVVERDRTILLARNARFRGEMWSALAGFVEPGESIEDTVHREIREEVGIEVDGLRYFGSQPWPFPHSLMVAFHANWAGGDLRPDEDEIIDAAWFPVGELPAIPPPISIARSLIDDSVARLS